MILVVLLALLASRGSADAREQAQVRSELRQAADALKLVWQDGDESATEEDDDYAPRRRSRRRRRRRRL